MRHVLLFRFLFLTGLLLLSTGRGFAQELSVEANVDETRPGVDQPFTLVISVSGKNINSVPEPVLPTLNDFLVVGRTSSSSTSFNIVNTQVSSSQTIQYIYQLQPRQTGKFTIGSAVVTFNGTAYRTAPIAIEVVQASAGGSGGSRSAAPPPPSRSSAQPYNKEDLFLRAIVDKKQVYLGEQITVTFKLFTRMQVANAQYDRQPSFTGFWSEELFSAQHLDYQQQEVLDGKRYSTAILKKIALFPTVTGSQTIDPLTLICDVPVASGRNLLDNFFNDPFDPFSARTRQVEIRTAPQTVAVLPLPREGQPAAFGGAVGQFSIKGSIDKSKSEVGQPLTLTVDVSGDGNIKSVQELQLPDLAIFKQYASESKDTITPHDGRIGGRKTFSYVLIPLQPGDQRIDPVTFAFFDPVARTYKTVSTDPIPLSIAPGKDGTMTLGVVPQKLEVTQSRQDIQYIKPETVDLSNQDEPLYRTGWYWLFHLIPVIAVGAALAYRTHSDRLLNDVGYARWRRAYVEAKRELGAAEKALEVADLVQAFAHISNALFRYIGNKYNQPTAGLTTQQLTELLAAQMIDEATIVKIRQCLEACDMARFAPTLLTEASTREVFSVARNAIESIEQHLVKKK